MLIGLVFLSSRHKNRSVELSPDEEDDSQLLVQLPAVHVAHDDQEDNGGEQAEGRIQQTCF